MIKREDLKDGLVFVLPIKSTDAFDRYVTYGTEHFSVSVRMYIQGYREVTRFEVVGVAKNGVRLWIKGAAPCRAIPEEEDFYVFVHSEVLDEVLEAAVLLKDNGTVPTAPHEDTEDFLRWTLDQQAQRMADRMNEYMRLQREKEEKVKEILKDDAPVETGAHEEGGNNRVMPKDFVQFKRIVDRMYDTFKRKNADYGNSFRELYKECGMTYAYGHMREKLERVRSLMKNEAQVKGESMKDSLYDLANYAVLTIMEIERNKEG